MRHVLVARVLGQLVRLTSWPPLDVTRYSTAVDAVQRRKSREMACGKWRRWTAQVDAPRRAATSRQAVCVGSTGFGPCLLICCQEGGEIPGVLCGVMESGMHTAGCRCAPMHKSWGRARLVPWLPGSLAPWQTIIQPQTSIESRPLSPNHTKTHPFWGPKT